MDGVRTVVDLFQSEFYDIFARRDRFFLNGELQTYSLARITMFPKEIVFFYLVLCPFQDYFTHRDEPIDRWGKTGVPRENHLTHPQAELGLSHMWPVRGSNLHQTQR